jgi:hypothetical protein
VDALGFFIFHTGAARSGASTAARSARCAARGRIRAVLYGPQVRDGAIVIDRLQGAEALPQGWASEQHGGTYRLRRREDAAVFGYVHGADSWKKLLHPAHLRLWSARREGGGFVVQADDDPPEPFALIGVRGCELRAIRSRTAYSWKASTSMPSIVRAAATRSSSGSIAASRAAPASAPQWAPGRRSGRVTIWR